MWVGPKTPCLQERDANRGAPPADGDSPNPLLEPETDEQEDERLKLSYNNYLKEEKKILVNLGLKKEDDPLQLIT